MDPAGTFDDVEEGLLRAPRIHEAKIPPPKPASVKAASKAPSKKASEAEDAGLGMFGLFDGCGDAPNSHGLDGVVDDPYRPYRKRSPERQTVRGRFRLEDEIETRQRVPRHEGHHRGKGRESDEEEGLYRLRHHTQHRPREAAPRSSNRRESDHERADFLLVEELSDEILRLAERGVGEVQRHLKLEQESHAHRRDPAVFSVMARAVQRKAQEVGAFGEEIRGLYRSIEACIGNMDHRDRRRTESYLLDKGVLPEIYIELRTPLATPVANRAEPILKQNFEKPFRSSQLSRRTVSGGSLWQRKQQQQRNGSLHWREEPNLANNNANANGNDMDGVDRWSRDSQNNANVATAPPGAWPGDTYEQKAASWGVRSQINDGGWGTAAKKGSDGWGQSATHASSQQAQSRGRPDDAWGNSGGEQQNTGWGNETQQEEAARGGGDTGWHSTEENNAGGDTWGEDANKQDSGEQNNSWDQPEDQQNTEGHENDWNTGENDQNNNNQGDGWGNDQNNSGDQDQGGGWDTNTEPEANNNEDPWGGNAEQAAQPEADAWGQQDQNTPKAASKAASKAAWGNDGAEQEPSKASKPADLATSVSAVRPTIKSYWRDWNKPSEEVIRKLSRKQPRNPYDYPPAPPPAAAPSRKAESVLHGVAAGPGARYAHATYRPEYLDTMEKPYAVFTFKYRPRERLEKQLGRRIDTTYVKKAVEAAQQEMLMRLPKDELVSELMKRQMLLDTPRRVTASRAGGSGGGAAKPAWGDRSAVVVKAASSSKKSQTPASNHAAWGAQADVKPSDSVSQQGSDAGGWVEVKGDGKPASNNGNWGNDQGGDAVGW